VNFLFMNCVASSANSGIRCGVQVRQAGTDFVASYSEAVFFFLFSFPVASTECGLGICARGLAVQRDVVSSPLHIVSSKPGWRR